MMANESRAIRACVDATDLEKSEPLLEPVLEIDLKPAL